MQCNAMQCNNFNLIIIIFVITIKNSLQLKILKKQIKIQYYNLKMLKIYDYGPPQFKKSAINLFFK